MVGTWDGDPARFARIKAAYEGFGAKLIVPEIARSHDP